MRYILIASMLLSTLCIAQTAPAPGSAQAAPAPQTAPALPVQTLTVAPAPQPAAGVAIFRGTVSDSTGAVLVGATVTVTNAAGGAKTATTDDKGQFVFQDLAVASYNVTSIAPKFKEFKTEGFAMVAGDENSLDIQLLPAGEMVQVEVVGQSATQIETENAEIAGTISQKEVVTMGLNGRNFTQLLTLTPGVSNQTQQDEAKVGVVGSAKYSVNGGRVEYNSFDVDGTDVLNTGIAASRGHTTLTVYPSLDAIQEMKVLTSNYGAQYGRSASGTVLVTTKSGEQQYHGNAYAFLRNDAFNASGFKDPPGGAPLYRRTDVGGTLGGPLFIPKLYNTSKKKTFFFFSEEARLERSPTLGNGVDGSFNHAVPSIQEREGNFSELWPAVTVGGVGTFSRKDYPDCPSPTPIGSGETVLQTFPGNIVPIASNGAQRALLNTGLIPIANSPSGCAGASSLNPGFVKLNDPTTWPCYNVSISPLTYWREELFRIDHNLTTNVKGYFRFVHDTWDTTTSTPQWQYGGITNSTNSFPTVMNHFVGPGVSMVGHLTAIHGTSLVNDFSAGFTTDHISLTAVPGAGATLTRPAGLDLGYIFPDVTGKIPAIYYAGSNAAYGGSGFVTDTSYMPWSHSNPTITIRDDVSKMIGHHTLQFGVLYLHSQQSEVSSATGANTGNVQGLIVYDNVSNLSSTGNVFADSLLTNPESTAGTILYYQQDSAQGVYSNHYSMLEPYLQDDWKVAPRFQLNLGLRVSLFGNWTPNGSPVFNFDPRAYDPALAHTIAVNPLYGYVQDAATGTPILASASSPSAATINGLVQCGANGVPESCMSSHHFNPAPRIGFAWDPTGHGKTSIRAGYGLFWEHGTGDEANSGSLTGSAPLVQSMTQNSPQGSQFSPQCIGGRGVGCNIPAGAAYPLDVVAIPTKAVWPYVQQWSLSVQHQLNRDTVVTLAYVGSKGTHLTTVRQLNQFAPVSSLINHFGPHEPIFYNDGNETGVCYRPGNATPDGNNLPFVTADGHRYNKPDPAHPSPEDPAYFNLEVACSTGINPNSFRRYLGYGRILSIENVANSSYHALQFTVHHTHGPLNLGIAYTYGHSIDEASDRFSSALGNSLDPSSNRASSDFDQRHILNLTYVYKLPIQRWYEHLWNGTHCVQGDVESNSDCGKVGAMVSYDGPGKILNALLNGWELSGNMIFVSGTPFSIVNGGSTESVLDNAGVANGLGAGSYPDVVRGGGSCAPDNGSAPGPRLGNPCEFVAPRGLTFGNAGRNFMNNPNRLNFDAALHKQFILPNENHVEARVEFFNLFNTAQYRIYDPGLGNTASNTVSCYGDASESYSAGAPSCQGGGAFLHPVNAHRPFTMQFGVKYAF